MEEQIIRGGRSFFPDNEPPEGFRKASKASGIFPIVHHYVHLHDDAAEVLFQRPSAGLFAEFRRPWRNDDSFGTKFSGKTSFSSGLYCSLYLSYPVNARGKEWTEKLDVYDVSLHV